MNAGQGSAGGGGASGETGPGAIARWLTALVACDDLPERLPDEPMALLGAWYEDASRSGAYEDFNAMVLATATPDGVPSSRVVLCKALELEPGSLVFYTNYRSRKGRELDSNPRASCVFHWTHARRQARLEGVVGRVSEAESEAYFASRPLLSRVGAIVSRQSEPLASRAALVGEAGKLAAIGASGGRLERPEHWGGYRLTLARVELWSARNGRLHDRAVWVRDLEPAGGDGVSDGSVWRASAWRGERLQP